MRGVAGLATAALAGLRAVAAFNTISKGRRSLVEVAVAAMGLGVAVWVAPRVASWLALAGLIVPLLSLVAFPESPARKTDTSSGPVVRRTRSLEPGAAGSAAPGLLSLPAVFHAVQCVAAAAASALVLWHHSVALELVSLALAIFSLVEWPEQVKAWLQDASDALRSAWGGGDSGEPFSRVGGKRSARPGQGRSEVSVAPQLRASRPSAVQATAVVPDAPAAAASPGAAPATPAPVTPADLLLEGADPPMSRFAVDNLLPMHGFNIDTGGVVRSASGSERFLAGTDSPLAARLWVCILLWVQQRHLEGSAGLRRVWMQSLWRPLSSAAAEPRGARAWPAPMASPAGEAELRSPLESPPYVFCSPDTLTNPHAAVLLVHGEGELAPGVWGRDACFTHSLGVHAVSMGEVAARLSQSSDGHDVAVVVANPNSGPSAAMREASGLVHPPVVSGLSPHSGGSDTRRRRAHGGGRSEHWDAAAAAAAGAPAHPRRLTTISEADSEDSPSAPLGHHDEMLDWDHLTNPSNSSIDTPGDDMAASANGGLAALSPCVLHLVELWDRLLSPAAVRRHWDAALRREEARCGGALPRARREAHSEGLRQALARPLVVVAHGRGAAWVAEFMTVRPECTPLMIGLVCPEGLESPLSQLARVHQGQGELWQQRAIAWVPSPLPLAAPTHSRIAVVDTFSAGEQDPSLCMLSCGVRSVVDTIRRGVLGLSEGWSALSPAGWTDEVGREDGWGGGSRGDE